MIGYKTRRRLLIAFGACCAIASAAVVAASILIPFTSDATNLALNSADSMLLDSNELDSIDGGSMKVTGFSQLASKRLHTPLTDPPVEKVESKRPAPVPTVPKVTEIPKLDATLVGTVVDPASERSIAWLKFAQGQAARMVRVGDRITGVAGEPKVIEIEHELVRLKSGENVFTLQVVHPSSLTKSLIEN